MIRFIIFIAILVQAVLASGIQGQVLTLDTNVAVQQPVSISGVVTQLNKYSFRLRTEDEEHQVRLANDALVALQLNKPWFDWKNQRVVVQAKNHAHQIQTSIVDTSAISNQGNSKRVAYMIPSGALYVISRFPTVGKMEHVMSRTPIHLNTYLITTQNPGEHYPTKAEPFLSSQLFVSEESGKTEVEFDQRRIRVTLGHRRAAIAGFSIQQLKPATTWVTINGRLDQNGQIVAEQILFQPLVAAN